MKTAEEIAKSIPFSGEDDSLPQTPLTQAQYTSPEWHEYDLKHVFGRRWLFAGHGTQIKKPGEFFTFALGHESVIVSRTKSGEIRAFHNSCRHRGTRVCQETSGRKKYFTCPFHGWSYDLEGQLKVAPIMPDSFDKSRFPLKPVWSEEWAGMIFLNLSPEKPAGSVADHMRGIDLSPYQLDRTKVIADVTYEIDSNWKITAETYQECYHCALNHPELVRVIKTEEDLEEWAAAEGVQDTTDKDFLIWTSDAGPGMQEGAVTFSMDGQYVSKKMLGDGSATLPCAALSWFPNLGFFVQPDYAVTTSWLPTSPTTSVMRSTWLVHEDAVEGEDYTIEGVKEIMDVTNEQDKRLCRLAQLGVNSSGYDNSAPYQPQLEAPVRGFLDTYLDIVERGEQPVGVYR
ncbi:aromatic ring-hydroxylating oxygenase subunit alpha [Streptomyces sp. BH106]|uniref:aromatic ring-hydroxylating oxygenase subunit alpha n=1 Tax=Streptomyces sp. BH106 TaxID=3410409 RepID=UPI003CF8D265